MSIPALSSAAFSQYVASSSNIDASQQALQSLQNSLSSGDLTAAQTAFNTYQALTQKLANSSGTTTSTNAQFSTDLAALGSAIASGYLLTSRSAFATVQADAKAATSPAIAAALAAASQTVTEIEDLLSVFNTSNAAPTNTDPFTTILNTAYGQNSSASTTDPTTTLLEGQYGANAVAASSDLSGTVGVNVYA
jgi:hypothetical protein